jgi:histidinol-phosphatase (PHP family)
VRVGPRPADRDLPLDAHLHTVLSPDADARLDDYAEAAVERGISELAITDHVDFEPGAPAYAFTSFEERERMVRQAAERWADRVAIRFGVEITFQSSREADIRAHLARHRYDFVIGSVHVMAGSPYEASRVGGFCAGRSLAEIVAPYYAEVEAAARSELFDALGHVDFVKRYLVPHVSPDRLSAAPELLEPVLQALVESGTALEMNTSGLRQAARETYPAPWAIARFHELGGRRVSIGSDAHKLASFAAFLADGYRAVADVGFEQLHFRRGDEAVTVAIPARVTA